MSQILTVLLAADDPDLATEWEAAESRSGIQIRRHEARSLREVIDVAQTRHPDVICIALPWEVVDLASYLSELREVAPRAVVVGVIDRREFGSGDAESAYLVDAMRAGVRDFLRRPLSADDFAACMRRAQEFDRPTDGGAPARGRVACFVSNKGGVGKTTLSVNVACELARRAPGQVMLIDAALQLGLCSTMLDLEPTVTMHDVVEQIDRLDQTLLRELATPHECGLDLLAAPRDAIEAAAIREDHLARILGVARSAYRYVVIDTFPMLDGIAIAALDRADEVLQVVAPTVPTVLGAERLIETLEAVGVEQDRQRVIVNVSIPPRSGRLSTVDVATRLGRVVDFEVPFTRAAIVACNTGYPATLASPRRSPFRRSIADMADLIASPTPEAVG